MDSYEIAVIGLGGMGSAVLAECARRGVKAIGVDRHEEGHDRGSSHGRSRLFRKAYFEDDRYVPLLHRAEELWRRLEEESETTLLRVTGLLMAGAKDSQVIERSFRAAEKHGLPTERLGASDVTDRFPALRVRADEIAIYEPAAGVVDPEKATRANLALASAGNAERRHGLTMIGWKADAAGIRITFDDDSAVRAKHLILTLGPWFAWEMRQCGIELRIQRNVQAWFEPANEAFDFPKFPAFLVDRPQWSAALYGFPDFGEGVKAAFHGCGDFVEPDQMIRAIDQENDIVPLQRALGEWMPGAGARFLTASACMYSLTPDGNFVIDRHPVDSRVILCGGFSGHGFKFAPVIGEIVLDLALEGLSQNDIGFLSLARFS